MAAFKGVWRSWTEFTTQKAQTGLGRLKICVLRRNFWKGVPLGVHTIRWSARPKKGRKDPKCVPKQVWTHYDTLIPRFCILSEKKSAPPGPWTDGGHPLQSLFVSKIRSKPTICSPAGFSRQSAFQPPYSASIQFYSNKRTKILKKMVCFKKS